MSYPGYEPPTPEAVVYAICRAQFHLEDAYGNPLIDGLIPPRVRVVATEHSTAQTVHIYAVRGKEELLLWYKTAWCSPNYEFNEQGKTIGLQDGCWFAEETLDRFFDKVIGIVKKADMERDIERREEERETRKLYDEKVARFERAWNNA